MIVLKRQDLLWVAGSQQLVVLRFVVLIMRHDCAGVRGIIAPEASCRDQSGEGGIAGYCCGATWS